MLADFGGDDRILVLRQREQTLYCQLGHDLVLALGVGKAVTRLPARNPRLPFAKVARLAGTPCLDQLIEHGRTVADDTDIDGHHLVDAGAVDIDVNLLRSGRERVEPSGHAVVEPRTDVHHHVALVHRHVRFERAVHAQHTQPVRMVGGESAQAHQRRSGRRAGQLLKLAQQLARARTRIDDPAAGVENRAFGIGDQLDRLGDFVGGSNHARLIAPRALRRTVREGRGGHLHVLGNVDHDRAGATGGGNLERFLNRGGEFRGVLHEIIVLGAVARQANRIRLLKGIGADQVRGNLSGDDHQRDRIHEGIGNAGDGIGRARARGDEDDARLAGRAGVAFGGMRRASLVPDEDMADAIVRKQLVIDGQHCAARIAEHEFDALADQHFAQYRSAAAFFGHDTSPTNCPVEKRLTRHDRSYRAILSQILEGLIGNRKYRVNRQSQNNISK